jgi:hypothetical protein
VRRPELEIKELTVRFAIRVPVLEEVASVHQATSTRVCLLTPNRDRLSVNPASDALNVLSKESNSARSKIANRGRFLSAECFGGGSFRPM